MDYVIDIMVFLVKIFAFVIATLLLVAGLIALSQRSKGQPKSTLQVTLLNDKFRDLAQTIRKKVYGKKEFKQASKQEHKQLKAQAKAKDRGEEEKKRVYVVDFKGDIRASRSKHLRNEITGLLKVARPQDEIVCRLDSPGGMVHSYGLAASQLARIRAKNIPLTVCIDKVAASGGYLMAAVANNIIAAPYAIIGSIGVVAQIPNFNRFLKKHNVDYELLTAGEYKRTLSVLGPNTAKGRKKFIEELEAIHTQFKNTIKKYRPQIDIDKVATGEHWLAEKAFEYRLVDRLSTSDDYLLELADNYDIYLVKYHEKAKLSEKFVSTTQNICNAIMHKIQESSNQRWWG